MFVIKIVLNRDTLLVSCWSDNVIEKGNFERISDTHCYTIIWSYIGMYMALMMLIHTHRLF